MREARLAGRTLVDLTVSNPTRCGFTYESDTILAALHSPAAMTYEPDPRGLLIAREAVAGYYHDHGAMLDPGHVVLTTSTSEAYSFLFRLLCDPGDTVLAPQPSYPLFDFVAGLDDVALVPYSLFYDFGWWIDFAALEERIGATTRAILLVHPNNPTGHATERIERGHLEELCVRRGLTLIVDEVFLDYSLETPIESFARGTHPCLTFVVSGLSKIAALPQMKVAWITVFGPPEKTQEALSRLEVIADTYLSMSAPVQHALPAWLSSREAIQKQILARIRENLRSLEGLSEEGMTLYPIPAGWSAVLRVPLRWIDDSTGRDIAQALVEEARIIVHPGSFYGMAETGLKGSGRDLVISLIGKHAEFQNGTILLKKWSESKALT